MKLSKFNPLNWFKTKPKRDLFNTRRDYKPHEEFIEHWNNSLKTKPMITLSKSQQIIFTLKQYPRQTIHEIAKKTGLSLKDVSRHLADLRGRGKVDRDLDGAIVNDNKCAVWYLK